MVMDSWQLGCWSVISSTVWSFGLDWFGCSQIDDRNPALFFSLSLVYWINSHRFQKWDSLFDFWVIAEWELTGSQVYMCISWLSDWLIHSWIHSFTDALIYLCTCSLFQRRFWFKQYLSYLFQSLSYLFLGRFCSWNKCFVRDQFTDGQHSFFLCQVWGELRYYQTTGECSESLQLCLQLSAGDCSVFQHRNVSNTNHPWHWVLWFCLTVCVI